MVERSDVSDILSNKCLLIKGLEENISKDFTSEEQDLLHSKHGRIKVRHKSGAGKVYHGITGAFKVGLPVIINSNPVKTVPKNTTIDWYFHLFQTLYGVCFNFELTLIKVRVLTSSR